MKTIQELLKDLAIHGGAIVNRTACNQPIIDLAAAEDRAAVDDATGFVYVRIPSYDPVLNQKRGTVINPPDRVQVADTLMIFEGAPEGTN